MAYPKDKINQVRKSYIFDNLPLDKCAVLHGISYPTVQRWKKQALDSGDDWDKVKSAQTLAGGQIEDVARALLTDLVIIFKSTMDGVKNDDLDAKTKVQLLASLADSYNKSISANKKLMPVTDKLAVAMTVMEMLGKYIQEYKPEAMAVFVEILVPFGELLSKEFE